jgi:hypothetical protein
MAHQVVLLYDSDMSEFIEVDGDHSAGHSGADSNSSIDWAPSISRPNMSSKSESIDVASAISTAYYQCVEEDSLVECPTCGSYFELDTFYPRC